MSISRAARIETALVQRFAPTALQVIDQSAAHAGHAGASAAGETHYRIVMRASAFAGQTRLARQRAVMDALADEFASGLHALSLDLAPPDET